MLWRSLRMLLMSFLASACDARRPRGSGSTLDLGEQQRAAAGLTGRAVIAAGQIAQPWHVGVFSPSTVTLPDVRAGDAIIVLGIYWGDLPRKSSPAPSDDRGPLLAAVDQGPNVLGTSKPPVYAQIHYQLNASPGRHVITPPDLGGTAGDGTMYVLQVRGLTKLDGPVATGQLRATGTALPDVSVSLGDDAAASDLLIAIGGYDNTKPWPRAGITHPPEGWTAAGVQDDSSNNVPSEVCHRMAAAAGRQRVTWTWTDPEVNVTCAALAAFR